MTPGRTLVHSHRPHRLDDGEYSLLRVQPLHYPAGPLNPTTPACALHGAIAAPRAQGVRGTPAGWLSPFFLAKADWFLDNGIHENPIETVVRRRPRPPLRRHRSRSVAALP